MFDLIRSTWFKWSAAFKPLNWLLRLWLLAPVLIWFSYRPLLSLGSSETMNYKLSLTLIYISILAVVGLPMIWVNRRRLLNDKYVWLTSGFVAWSGLTIIWSANHTRAILTFGVLGSLYVIFLATWSIRDQFKTILPWLAKLLIGSAIVASCLALGQMLAGALTDSKTSFGLCAGCVAGQFGFVRPNLFAIEPQFLGNLLLAPALITLHRLITDTKRRAASGLIFILLATTIGLTLSRGAIYALVVAVVIMSLATRSTWWRKLWAVSLVAVSTGLCLSLQGGLAVLNPSLNETFWGSVAKSANHLSMGTIDFRDNLKLLNSTQPDSPSNNSSPATSPAVTHRAIYDGYVAESTDVRVNLTKTALAAWSKQSLAGRLFGFGLGSAGLALAKQTGSDYKKEIVQNEYIEVLLERGLIGFVLLFMLIAATWHRLSRQSWAWVIGLAYLVQWCFFSGLPSVLHMYLVIMCLLVELNSSSAGKNLPDRFK